MLNKQYVAWSSFLFTSKQSKHVSLVSSVKGVDVSVSPKDVVLISSWVCRTYMLDVWLVLYFIKIITEFFLHRNPEFVLYKCNYYYIILYTEINSSFLLYLFSFFLFGVFLTLLFWSKNVNLLQHFSNQPHTIRWQLSSIHWIFVIAIHELCF